MSTSRMTRTVDAASSASQGVAVIVIWVAVRSGKGETGATADHAEWAPKAQAACSRDLGVRNGYCHVLDSTNTSYAIELNITKVHFDDVTERRLHENRDTASLQIL